MEENTEAQDLARAEPSARVLVVHPSAPTLRLIRETLNQFTTGEVDTTPDAVYGFELALQRRYKLYIFGVTMEVLDGVLLYELISKAHGFCHAEARSAPGVLFLSERSAARRREEFARDARVKGVLGLPLKIERLLEGVKGTLEVRDGFEGLAGKGEASP
jgi:CheY-like chemotaxis protein